MKGEINEAKREAQLLSRDSELAARQLEQTQPPARVEANVTTETEVVEQTRAPVETVEREEVIPVRGTIVADAGAGVDGGESTMHRSTTTAPERTPAANSPAASEPAPRAAPAPSDPAPALPAPSAPAPMPPR